MALLQAGITGPGPSGDSRDIRTGPVTVILGDNGTGKSTLARLPRVIADGIQGRLPAEGMLPSGGNPDGGTLVSAVLGDSDGTATVSLRVRLVPGPRRSTAVRSLAVTCRGQDAAVDLPRTGTCTITVPGLRPLHHDGPFPFRGFLPDPGAVTALVPDGAAAGRAAAILGEAVREAARCCPAVRHRPPAGNTGRPAGRDPALVDAATAEAARSLLTRLIPGTAPGAALGTGATAIMPFLAQWAADARTPPDTDVTEVLEQPEAALHPDAHGALADLLLEGAARGRVRYLVETHSEILMLRLRRRIAEGSATADSVHAYVTGLRGPDAHTASPVTISSDGNAGGIPDGFFTSGYEEAQALAAAVRNRDETAREAARRPARPGSPDTGKHRPGRG